MFAVLGAVASKLSEAASAMGVVGGAVSSAVPTSTSFDLISVKLGPHWSLTLEISVWVAVAIAVGFVAYLAWQLYWGGRSWREFEIDEADVGIGTSKITLRPNTTDRQVAYSIWVELSTRKIGLEIDFSHDVVIEIYDSWYAFFGITRDLLKTIPVNKVRGDSTGKIIRLSMDVLNQGLRPHLTMWQARFRRWYENELKREASEKVIDPQEIQERFPRWGELKEDMENVNRRLIAYRTKMDKLITSP